MCALGGFAHEMLELGEDLLDRVQVGAVGRQEQQPGTDAANGLADGWTFVAAEIVHDNDIAGRQRRHETLLDIVGEDLAVDRLVEDARCVDPVAAQSGKKRHRTPMTVRHLGVQPPAPGCPSPQRSHVRFGPCFVDEHEPRRIKPTLIFLPLLASARDRRPQLFGGKNAFF